MEIRQALTFDDVMLVPSASSILPGETDTRTRITREIQLGIPLISAAIDTATEGSLAIAMAQAAGRGVIQRNMPNDQQAAERDKAKTFDAGIVLNTVKDIEKAQLSPQAAKDEHGRLRVAAAAGTGKLELERAETLFAAGVDIMVVDTAHGHSSRVLDAVSEIRQMSNYTQVIVGNVATAEGARAVIEAGADAVKVGIGPGSICTTRMVAGVGVPQFTAIADAVEDWRKQGVPVIAAAGIKFSGDLAKAI